MGRKGPPQCEQGSGACLRPRGTLSLVCPGGRRGDRSLDPAPSLSRRVALGKLFYLWVSFTIYTKMTITSRPNGHTGCRVDPAALHGGSRPATRAQ